MRTLLLALLCLIAVVLQSPTSAQERPTSPRAARIESDLRSILAGPDYSVGPEKESVLQKIGRWLEEKWNNFWKWVSRLFSFGGRIGPGASQAIMWVVLAGLIVAIAFVLAYGMRRFGWGFGKTRSAVAVTSVGEEIEEKLDDPDGLLAAARDLAAAGQYRRAYRAIFLAILLRLDRAGHIHFERSRTNGEYIRSLRSRPDIISWMRPLTNDFDLRWYGGGSVGELDYRRVMSVYEQIPLTSNQ